MASVLERVREVLLRDPNVTGVELVGSRDTGTDNPLSDWDIRISAHDYDELAAALPSLTEPLRPLAAQWDPLSDHAVFMLMLPGAIKVDLFPGDRPWTHAPPWQPGPATLAALDAHFWDWIVWLGSKALGGKDELVATELVKLHGHLLGPLGATAAPESVGDAIDTYLRFRADAEARFGVTVDPRLGDEVAGRLRATGVTAS